MRTNKSLSECQAILGLAPGASAAEIRRAYLNLVKKWHPDRFPIDQRLRLKAEEKLKAINEAYAVLRACQPASTSSATSQAYTKRPAYNRPASAGERPRYTYSQARSEPRREYKPSSQPRTEYKPPPSEPPRYDQTSSTGYDAPKSRHFAAPRRATRFLRWLPLIFLISILFHFNADFARPSLPAETQAQQPVTGVLTIDPNSLAPKWTPDQREMASFLSQPLKPKPVGIKLSDTRIYLKNSMNQLPNAATAESTGSFQKVFPTNNVSNMALRDPVFITVGSTKEEVRAIQGEPTSYTDNEWRYGSSSIHFFDGRVVGWTHGLGSPLKIIGVPELR